MHKNTAQSPILEGPSRQFDHDSKEKMPRRPGSDAARLGVSQSKTVGETNA
jgi:hypothetical protein